MENEDVQYYKNMVDILTEQITLTNEDYTEELMGFTENVNRVFDGIEATYYYKRDFDPYVVHLYKLFDEEINLSRYKQSKISDLELFLPLRGRLFGTWEMTVQEDYVYEITYQQLVMQLGGFYVDYHFKLNEQKVREIQENLEDLFTNMEEEEDYHISVDNVGIRIQKLQDGGKDLTKTVFFDLLGNVFQTMIKSAVVYRMVMDEGIPTHLQAE